MDVLRDPHLTICCGQHYCASCLTEWDGASADDKNVCLHCRSREFSHILDKCVERKVKELKLHCEYYKEGCRWTGELFDLECHLKHCGRSLISCVRGCGDKLRKRELDDHLKNHCVQRNYECEHCSLAGSYWFITTKHYQECSEFPLKCPNQCCSTFIKRSLINKHLKRCPMQHIDCSFQPVGCDTRIIRVDQQQHLATNVHNHFELMLRAMQQSSAALIIEAELLTKYNSQIPSQKLPLESLKTLSGSYSTQLREGNPTLTFRMSKYSDFKSSGRYWRSPTFSIDGYKMCLTVVARGLETGRGTHVSVLLKADKHNKQLCWTNSAMKISMVPQEEDSLISECICVVYGKNVPWKSFEEKDGLPVRLFACPQFVQHGDILGGMLLSDSLVFQIRRLRMSSE